MQLILNRNKFTATTTIGDLYINDSLICKTLEDTDRDLKQSMELTEIVKLKQYGVTAIPAGTYEVVISHSPRMNKTTPELLNVPGYEGIRIHPGNYAKDTLGCILPGRVAGNDMVLHSVDAFEDLMHLMQNTNEKITITINSNKILA